MPKLSICIPTYNFGQFIGATLKSIVDQIDSDMEVIVVDGASTDNTGEVVAPYTSQFPNIKYYLLEEKGGIDIDMARSMELATGEYCWLFSSDDVMYPDAIARLLSHLDQGWDVVLATHTNCTIDMTPIGPHPVLDVGQDSSYDFSVKEDLNRYFEIATTTEAFFSFMSGLIIRKSYWDKVDLNPDFIGSCWAHAARLFQINNTTPLRINYIKQPLLYRRGDNDSFASNGLVNRYAIAIIGYNKIADTYFGNQSRQAWNIRRTLRNEYSLKSFLYAKHCCYQNPKQENLVLLNQLVVKFYCEASVRHTLCIGLYNVLTKSPLAIMIWVYQALQKK